MMAPIQRGYASRMIEFGSQLDLSIRLLVAAALGLAIGFEREIHGHPAGLRTHMLVALGSALFTVLSIHGFLGTSGAPVDSTRIAAQIVSGIGFLGAGAILKDGIVVRGLTTAASLWATSAVGMAAGAGEYLIGVVAAVVILVSLWPINAIADRLHGVAGVPETHVRLSMKRVDAIGQVSEILIANKLEIGQLATTRLAKDNYQADIAIRSRSSVAIAAAIEAMAELAGVDVVSTTQGD